MQTLVSRVAYFWVLVKNFLFFANFCFADCCFSKFYGTFSVSNYCKTKFGRVFVLIYSFWACFFAIASTRWYLINLLVLFCLIFLPNAIWACFSVKLLILGLILKCSYLLLQNNLLSLQASDHFHCYCRNWWGIIQSSSTSKWIRQRLMHSWSQLDSNVVFILLKSVECGRSDVQKNFGCQWRV